MDLAVRISVGKVAGHILCSLVILNVMSDRCCCMGHLLFLFPFAETPGYGGGYGKADYGEYNVQIYVLAKVKLSYISHCIP